MSLTPFSPVMCHGLLGRGYKLLSSELVLREISWLVGNQSLWILIAAPAEVITSNINNSAHLPVQFSVMLKVRLTSWSSWGLFFVLFYFPYPFPSTSLNIFFDVIEMSRCPFLSFSVFSPESSTWVCSYQWNCLCNSLCTGAAADPSCQAYRALNAHVTSLLSCLCPCLSWCVFREKVKTTLVPNALELKTLTVASVWCHFSSHPDKHVGSGFATQYADWVHRQFII